MFKQELVLKLEINEHLNLEASECYIVGPDGGMWILGHLYPGFLVAIDNVCKLSIGDNIGNDINPEELCLGVFRSYMDGVSLEMDLGDSDYTIDVGVSHFASDYSEDIIIRCLMQYHDAMRSILTAYPYLTYKKLLSPNLAMFERVITGGI